MALWKNTRQIGRGMRTSTALVTLAAVVGITTPALAQFPGEKWSVDYVRVEGDAPVGVANAVNLGLRKAGETYFYGGVPTRLVATVRDAASGLVDLQLIDNASGAVIGERRGLTFEPTEGDVAPNSSASRAIANTIRAGALSWMGGLGCGDNCAVAVNNAALTQIATAPATATPEPADAPAAQEDVAPEADTASTAVAEATAVADPEPSAEPAPAVTPLPDTQPAVAETRQDTVPATKPRAATVETPETDLAQVAKPSLGAESPAIPAASPDAAPSRPKVSLNNPSVSSARKLDNQTLAEIDAITRGAPEPAPTVAPSISEPAITSAIPTSRPSLSVDSAADVAAATQSETPTVPAAPLAEPTTGSAASLAGLPLETGGADTDAEPEAAPNTQAPAIAAAPETDTTDPVTLGAAADETPEAPTIAGIAEAVQVPAAPTAPQNDTPESEAPFVARSEDSVGQLALVNPSSPTGGGESGASSLPGETTAPPRPSTVEADALPEVLSGDVTPVPPEAPAADTAPQADTSSDGDLDGEVLALADPVAPVTPTQRATELPPAEATPSDSEPDLSGIAPDDGDGEPVTTVETQIAAVDPTAEGPTLANARWVGFTPAVFTGSDQRDGIWISGPFDRQQRKGWITDTATGATTQVTFVWRDAASGGRTATLSRAAAKALGLGQGDVANVAVYLPR